MNFKSLAVIIAILLVGLGSWYYFSEQQRNRLSEEITTQHTEASNDYKLYRNEEWGFEFQYPKDWKIREPAFGSAVSLFNMDVGPNGVGILINITPKYWIEDANEKKRARGVTITETEFKGREALTDEVEQGIWGLTENYYVLINDSYWIHISIQKKQEEVLKQVLTTFKFLE